MNVYAGPMDRIRFHLLRGLLKSFQVDQQILAEYADTYQVSDGIIVTIRVNGTRIYFQVPGSGEGELIAISGDWF
jgi:hypothetical protein